MGGKQTRTTRYDGIRAGGAYGRYEAGLGNDLSSFGNLRREVCLLQGCYGNRALADAHAHGFTGKPGPDLPVA